MFSPLIIIALNHNQIVAEKFTRYSCPIYWSQIDQKIYVEGRARQLFVWKFVNFGVLAGILFPSSLFVLWDAFRNPEKYNTFQTLLNAMQTLMNGLFPCFALIFWKLRHETMLVVNALTAIEHIISYPRFSYRNKKGKRDKSCRVKIQECQVFEIIRQRLIFNGAIDFVGISAVISVPILWLFPTFVTCVGVYFDLDSTCYFLQIYLPSCVKLPVVREFLVLFRFALAYTALLNVCRMVQTYGILGVAFAEALKKYVSRLTDMTLSFRKWRILQIEFQTSHELVSRALSIALGGVFSLEVVAITGSILAIGKIPWYKYFIFPFTMIIAAILMSQFFREIICLHTKSLFVKQKWILWCTTVKNRNRHRFGLKLADKLLKVMKPLAFSYGSLGSFTKGTRTDFYYSIIEYSIGFLLSYRKFLGLN